MYFPPIGSDTWETVTPQSLGWDITKLNEAIDYAGTKNTYGLIILYKGRIVTENYWNGWNKNTVYYIASAGKSVTAFLAGIAQQISPLKPRCASSAARICSTVSGSVALT